MSSEHESRLSQNIPFEIPDEIKVEVLVLILTETFVLIDRNQNNF